MINVIDSIGIFYLLSEFANIDYSKFLTQFSISSARRK